MKIKLYLIIFLIICFVFCCSEDNTHKTYLLQPASLTQETSDNRSDITKYDWNQGRLEFKSKIMINEPGRYNYFFKCFGYSEMESNCSKNGNLDIPSLSGSIDSLRTIINNLDNLKHYSINVYFSKQLEPGVNEISTIVFYNYEFRVKGI